MKYSNDNYKPLMEEYRQYYQKEGRLIYDPPNLFGLIAIIVGASVFITVGKFIAGDWEFSWPLFAIVMLIDVAIIPFMFVTTHVGKKRWRRSTMTINRKGTERYECAVDEYGFAIDYTAGKGGGSKAVFKLSWGGAGDRDMIEFRVHGRLSDVDLEQARFTLYITSDGERLFSVYLPGRKENRYVIRGCY